MMIFCGSKFKAYGVQCFAFKEFNFCRVQLQWYLFEGFEMILRFEEFQCFD